MKRTALKRKTRLEARAPLKRTPMQKAQKPRRKATKDCRFRSEPYLAFVRTLPCALCGAGPVDAHHVIGLGWGLSGMGMTAPDSYAMPLCRYHHGEVHKHPGLQPAQRTWLRWTLRRGLAEFTGDIAEQLVHALAFIEARGGDMTRDQALRYLCNELSDWPKPSTLRASVPTVDGWAWMVSAGEVELVQGTPRADWPCQVITEHNWRQARSSNQDDAINPDHYKVGGIETIDYMKAKATPEEFRGHLRLTAIKYLSRAGHKDEALQEYRKARWYLERLIGELEQ